jgi:hypothetical protein
MITTSEARAPPTPWPSGTRSRGVLGCDACADGTFRVDRFDGCEVSRPGARPGIFGAKHRVSVAPQEQRSPAALDGGPCHRQHRGAQFGRQRRPRHDDFLELRQFLCAQLCVGVGRDFRSDCGDASLQKSEHWWLMSSRYAGLGTIPAWAAICSQRLTIVGFFFVLPFVRFLSGFRNAETQCGHARGPGLFEA